MAAFAPESTIASTHWFAISLTLSTLIHPAVLHGKLNSFITSLMVGVGLDRLVILLEGLDGSVGNDVS